MKVITKLKIYCIGLAVLLIFFPRLSLAWLCQYSQYSCSDVLERGYLNVLSVNLLYSEFRNRETRLQNIVNFMVQQTEQGEPVDIILLQEVVGGTLSGTQNSSHDLKELLSERGLKYNLQYVLVNRIPGVITVGNAILSRCKVIFTLATTLPSAWEEPSEGFDIPLIRKAMMSRIRIPGFGKIDVYNTHLCAFCDPADRLQQTQALLEFITNVEKIIWWSEDSIILGGDFNINLNNPGEDTTYDEIIGFGFIDAYSVANGCHSCCSEEEGYLGCTYGVSGNPYAEVPARVDYIFTKGLNVLSSNVVFNFDPCWVSDHSGLLSKIALDRESH